MGMTYNDWHKRIDATLEWRTKFWNGDKSWRRYMALYRGDFWKGGKQSASYDDPDSETPRDRISVMTTGATVLLTKSFLLKQRAKFIINPRRPEDVVQCMLKQGVLNYEWKEKKVHRQVRRSVLDAIVIGHGIIKTGFTFREPVAKKQSAGNVNNKEYIEEGTPYVERVDPFRFLFDVEASICGDLDTAWWCAELFLVSQEDLLNNSLYNARVLSGIREGEFSPEYIEVESSSENSLSNDNLSKFVPCYEIYDKKYNKYYIMAKGVEKPLFEEDLPYEYLEGAYPYDKLDFIPLINEPYGIGIPYFIEDQQLELNRIRTSQFDHRRRYNRKYQVVENTMDQSEINKLISGSTGSVIITKRPNAIEIVPELTVPSEAYNQEAVIKEDIRDLTGTDQLVRGGNLPSRTSAAEIGARQQYTSLKLDDRVEDVDFFVEGVGRKLIQHISSNYDIERIVKIEGPQGAMWVKYEKDDIQGEFDMEVETMSAPRIDEATDRNQSMQLFQLIIQNLQTIMQLKIPFDFTELFKWIFGKFDQKDMGRFFPAMNQIQQPIQTTTGQQQTQNAVTPSVMNASDLREQMMGNASLGQGTTIEGIQ